MLVWMSWLMYYWAFNVGECLYPLWNTHLTGNLSLFPSFWKNKNTFVDQNCKINNCGNIVYEGNGCAVCFYVLEFMEVSLMSVCRRWASLSRLWLERGCVALATCSPHTAAIDREYCAPDVNILRFTTFVHLVVFSLLDFWCHYNCIQSLFP